jgi:hypothetical protein
VQSVLQKNLAANEPFLGVYSGFSLQLMSGEPAEKENETRPV